MTVDYCGVVVMSIAAVVLDVTFLLEQINTTFGLVYIVDPECFPPHSIK